MNLSDNHFLKSLFTLISGSFVSIIFLAIQHIALPYIFTPDELGIKAVILAIPTACIGIVCGRFDLPIVYEEDESQDSRIAEAEFYLQSLFQCRNYADMHNLFFVYKKGIFRILVYAAGYFYLSGGLWRNADPERL